MTASRRLLPASCVLLLAVLIASLGPARAGAARPAAGQSLPGALALVYAGPPSATPVRIRRPAAGAVPTATINVTYNGFSPEARAAFEYAVTIWEGLIVSGVPIEVVANWTALPPNVLGSAGPVTFLRDWSSGAAPPRANTWYPIGLANKLSGVDLTTTGTAHDITANFSSSFPNWYLGTDGNTPAGQYDFVSVVLHELGHGLGFVGSMTISGGNGSWGQATGFPFIYDRFAVDGAGQPLITAYPNGSAQLAAVLTGGGVFFNGPQAVAANGGANAPLHAPATWSQGSSYSHLGESFNDTPNALMTYSIGTGESIHAPGPVTLAMFRDMGWATGAPGGGSAKTYLPLTVKPAPASSGGGVANGDFESAGGWAESSARGLPVIGGPPSSMTARSGAKVAWMGGIDSETSAIQQSVAVPSGAPSVSFWYQVRSPESSCTFDTAALQINGTPIWTKGLCVENVTGAWVAQTVSLSAYAGQTVILSFNGVTDVSDPSSFVIDDVTMP